MLPGSSTIIVAGGLRGDGGLSHEVCGNPDWEDEGATDEVWRLDPTTFAWRQLAPLENPAEVAVLARLADGRVALVGGFDEAFRVQIFRSRERDLDRRAADARDRFLDYPTEVVRFTPSTGEVHVADDGSDLLGGTIDYDDPRSE